MTFEQYIQAAILLITAIIVCIKFSKILAWIIPSFEDNKGQASYKRLTAFALLSLDSYLILKDKIATSIMLHVHYSLLIAMLLTAAIITTENVITILSIVKGNLSPNDNESKIETKKIEGEVKVTDIG